MEVKYMQFIYILNVKKQIIYNKTPSIYHYPLLFNHQIQPPPAR